MTLFGLGIEELEYIIAIGAVVGLAYTAFRWVRAPYVKIMSTLERLTETADAVLGRDDEPGLLEMMEQQNEVLGQLKDEVLPNHGSSMNDRISLMLGETRSRLDSDHHTAYFSANRHGEWVWASRALLKWFGCKPEEATGFRWLGLVHPDDRDDVAAEWTYAMKAGRQTRLETMRIQNGAGGWLNVYFDAQPIYGGTNIVIGFHGWIRISSNQDPMHPAEKVRP